MQASKPLDSDFLYAAPHALGEYRLEPQAVVKTADPAGRGKELAK